MTINISKPKKKYKSYIPINIALTRKEKDAVKAPPHFSLKRCKENIGDATDWYNITFRVVSAYNISLLEYEEPTQLALKEVVDLLLVIKNKRTDKQFWFVTKEELDIIESGIEAMDQIGEECSRRVQLEAMLKTKDYLTQFVK